VHVRLPRHRGPALTSAEDVLALKPDGVFPLQRPRRSRAAAHAGRQHPQADRQEAHLRHLPRPSDCSASRSAASTYKLKFGHRGANHPVINELTKSRDHLAQSRLRGRPRFAQPNDIEITHVNLNDQTLEGFRIASPSSACSTTPKPRPARTIRTICSTISLKLMSGGRK
jgi:carbamoyl-phosphate synthase small subunit